MRMRESLVVAACAAALLAGGPVDAAAPIPVTVCGQMVDGQGELTGDLDCSAHGGSAVLLDGKLFLRGFTLTGNDTLVDGEPVIDCIKSCSVFGPGTVTGGTGTGPVTTPFAIEAPNKLTVENVTVTGNDGGGVRAEKISVAGATISANGNDGISGFKVTVESSTVTGNGRHGIVGVLGAKVEACDITFNGGRGIFSEVGKVKIADSMIDNSGTEGVRAAKSGKIENSQITNSGGTGVDVDKVKISGSSITGNDGDGAVGTLVSIKETDVDGNGGEGINAFKALVANGSSVSGNCTMAPPPPPECVDVRSCASFKLKASTCGTSLCSGFAQCSCEADTSWGLCSMD